MTDKEILIKAVNKARDNGYSNAFLSNEQVYEHRYEILFGVDEDKIWCFAKAFWGEQNSIGNDKTGRPIGIPITLASQTNSGVPMWQYHLQQIVILKNPIAYLEQFLGE